MTVPEFTTEPAAAIALQAVPATMPWWRRILTFGTGFGIAVNGPNLEVAIVRSRPSETTLVATTIVTDYLQRPAAEWGADLLRFLAQAGEKHLAATVLLPREDVIVRTLHLAGVPDKELFAAIELQIDTLHPYGDEEMAWTWLRTGPQDVAVGLVRATVLQHYETLFSEAGIPMAAATFSSAAIYAAFRVRETAPASVLYFTRDSLGRTEVYGESEARPLYSAALTAQHERALAVARAELRLDPAHQAIELSNAFASSVPVPLAYAAALASSAPFATRPANLLPPERRASHSRTQFLAPATLAFLFVVGVLFVFLLYPFIERRSYARDLDAETKKLEPAALRARQIAERVASDRQRTALLDDFRRRPQADLDLLSELSRLLPAPVWTSYIEIFPDSIAIAGEAEQAGPLLALLDSSPLLQNSEFVTPVTHNGGIDQFRIRSLRRNRTGRTTP